MKATRRIGRFLFGLMIGFLATVWLIGERGRWILDSTRRYWRESRALGQSWQERVHGYLYGTFPYHYINLGINGFSGPLSRTLMWIADHLLLTNGNETGTIADTYHGKVVPLEEATRFITVDQEISLRVPEEVVPFQRARDIVLSHPHDIVALDCPCRMAHDDPCLPLDVCLLIGQPFARFILEHHPDHARAISPNEAIEILWAEDGRGHVHHLFFKEAMLDRFYAICNCCSCCCGAMQAHRTGTPMLISSGYVAGIDAERCTGCGACQAYCQFHGLSTQGDRTVVNVAACMGCGVCVSKCQVNAISLHLDRSKGVPLEIERLMAQAASETPESVG